MGEIHVAHAGHVLELRSLPVLPGKKGATAKAKPKAVTGWKGGWLGPGLAFQEATNLRVSNLEPCPACPSIHLCFHLCLLKIAIPTGIRMDF